MSIFLRHISASTLSLINCHDQIEPNLNLGKNEISSFLLVVNLFCLHFSGCVASFYLQ